MDYRIISIGALSRHELWNEAGATRSAHSTCTLIRSEKEVILVDPGLPAQIIGARLQERAGIELKDITQVFLTCFRPSHRWGLSGLEHAQWFISELEREQMGLHLVEQFQQETKESDAWEIIKRDIALLKKCKPAPDQLAKGVDLFPSYGFTPGTCGLLLASPSHTVVVAGDAVATQEHLEQGRVLRGAYDAEMAKDSLFEIVEIADLIVPGHDNIQVNRMRRQY
jgi:glyoxylase-like metal-dependent hydrolase (beta-lactamase superfamily II)